MAIIFWTSVTILVATLTVGRCDVTADNEVSRTLSPEDLLTQVTEECTLGDTSVMRCLRQKVLTYVSGILGIRDEAEGRGLSDEYMDEVITSRVMKYVNTHQFKLQLPEFLFQEAVLTFRPGKSMSDFKVDFPEDPKNEERALGQARGHIKKKVILPLLLLLKLKLKAITPILLLLIGVKAFKAFVMSKISLLLVVVFLIVQLCKKAGMAMPAPTATEPPPPIYGPGPTPSSYGAPAPDNSYGPWEQPSNGNGGGSGGPYARWDSHNIAYSSYQPEPSGKTTQNKAGA